MRMQKKGIEGLSSIAKCFGVSSYANLSVAGSGAPAAGPEERTSLQSISFPFSLAAAQKSCLVAGGTLAAGHGQERDGVSAKVVPAQGKAKGCSAPRELISTRGCRACREQLFSRG